MHENLVSSFDQERKNAIFLQTKALLESAARSRCALPGGKAAFLIFNSDQSYSVLECHTTQEDGAEMLSVQFHTLRPEAVEFTTDFVKIVTLSTGGPTLVTSVHEDDTLRWLEARQKEVSFCLKTNLSAFQDYQAVAEDLFLACSKYMTSENTTLFTDQIFPLLIAMLEMRYGPVSEATNHQNLDSDFSARSCLFAFGQKIFRQRFLEVFQQDPDPHQWIMDIEAILQQNAAGVFRRADGEDMQLIDADLVRIFQKLYASDKYQPIQKCVPNLIRFTFLENERRQQLQGRANDVEPLTLDQVMMKALEIHFSCPVSQAEIISAVGELNQLTDDVNHLFADVVKEHTSTHLLVDPELIATEVRTTENIRLQFGAASMPPAKAYFK